MDSITFNPTHNNRAKTIDKVCEAQKPVAITRVGKDTVVMMSMKEYQTMEETWFLLRSFNNARRLVQSIAQLEEEREK
ncbi:MAG: type II toxin-antitoxin system Phd/YefM family antitoxin [Pseudomonadota bacterium]|nr:type II toxin-antitoxin system Phd/YefM family antitoxin [Pseudomonadota bacterium]